MTKAADISLAIYNRLTAIDTFAGYATDIGLKVLRGRTGIDDADIPCITMALGDDSVAARQQERHRLVLPYTLEAHHGCDPDNPNDTGEMLVGDIKRALFGPGDLGLGGLAQDDGLRYTGRRIFAREPGSTVVVAQVLIEVTYVEDQRQP